MKTVITRTPDGKVHLTVEGESAPEAVAREYLGVEKMLFPPTSGHSEEPDDAPKYQQEQRRRKLNDSGLS